MLKNLLSNAFKFTEQGAVRLSVSVAEDGWTEGHPVLSSAASGHRFCRVGHRGSNSVGQTTHPDLRSVPNKQIAGTSRKYGGTGLGLAISQRIGEFAGGGEIPTKERSRAREAPSRFICRKPMSGPWPPLRQSGKGLVQHLRPPCNSQVPPLLPKSCRNEFRTTGITSSRTIRSS